MGFPFVYLPGARLSQAELTAACLDGDVVAIGEAYAPADVVETPALRAASLAPLAGDSLAVTHVSAAWVHGAVETPPRRHTLQRAVERRLHHVIERRFAYRDTLVDRDDLVIRGAVPVTTTARTVADLARTPDPAHEAVLRAWARLEPEVITAAVAWLDAHPRIPYRRTARALLAALRTT
jgi:hypothetical protein